MWRKVRGYLLIIGSAAIIAIAISMALDPDVGPWRSIGPLLLAILFFVQGRSYISKSAPATAEAGPHPRERRTGNILDRLTAATPRFLVNFKAQDAKVDLARNQHSRPDFVTKQVSCRCGAENVEMLASRTEDGEILAPIYLRCSECSSQQLLFDPTIHGWDGENRDNASRVGDGEPAAVAPSPGNVIVVYSYQGIANYQDLIDEGEDHPENFFDTFAVYFARPGCAHTLVVSYECA